MKFRKRPVIIEAFRLGHNDIPSWAAHLKISNIHGVTDCYIETLEGKMYAGHGDWVIKGIKGELYPCKADIFEATYEKYSPPPSATEYFSQFSPNQTSTTEET